jgi:superfamily I DNA/RNA helicase
MKLEHVPHGQIEELRVLPVDKDTSLPGAFTRGAEVRLVFSERESVPLLVAGDEVLAITGEGRKNAMRLGDLCTLNLPRVAWIVDAAPTRLVVQAHTFLHALDLPPIDLGVDEKLLESLTRISKNLGKVNRAIEWLNEQFLVPDGEGDGTVRAFATANAAPGAGGFALHGRSARAFVRRSTGTDYSETLRVERVVRSNSPSTEEPLALVTGTLRFVDATVAGKLRVEAAAELASLSTGSSFLDVWKRYGELENEASLRRARRAGWLEYDHVESLPDNQFRFFLAAEQTIESAEGFKKALQGESGLSLEADAEVPEVLTREMTWAEYQARSQQSGTTAPAPLVTFDAKLELDRRNRVVTLTQRGGEGAWPPPQGSLFVSLQGDRTRLQRREEASRAIREARCPMRQLRLLLEGRPVPIAKRGNIPAVTPAVKRKVFGDRSPTPTQERALWVALNTPDIALIQGPPGTGKTTVIVALVERLQEVWDTSDGVQGRLLLSGFQHDAVENAIQRMNVNGLPPIKFGGRQNRREDADRVDATVERWSRDLATKLRARLPERHASVMQRELAALVGGYLLAPGTLEQTATMLTQATETLRSTVSTGLLDRMHLLARELLERVRQKREANPDRDRRVRHVRALRYDPVAFQDDGPRNASRVLRALERQGGLTGQAKTLLEAACDWSDSGAPPFLDALRALRRELLLELLPADGIGEDVPRARTDVLELLSEARDELDRRHRSSRDAADDAVLSFLDVLESEPETVKQALISYTSVFAATCQQSARHELARLKGSDSYDTVVVDEAARANPLDLFIPLARASRRIVLVGDHRQLPHVLDHELERELEEALSSGETAEQRTSDMLKESLFERLFNDLREREQRDGIRRIVTLDEQYRMHPALGDFVSEQFYARHRPEEAFRSPRPASDFAHGLPDHRGPAAWLEVPRSRGAEDSSGQSKSRPVEASVLVAELRRLMDSEAGRPLTFGVISFYSAQVETLQKELVSAGMMHRSEDSVYEALPPYREVELEDGRTLERLRVGTVDAFQGMEFDVVFLSMVRSNSHPDDSEKARRKKYGHLMSPNRLCVAMSRQKRLLIIVGDPEMLRAPHAAEAIGPLVKFRELCGGRDATGL